MTPQTLSIIRATFTDPKQRVQAIGLWAGVYGLGYGVGPVVGGALLEYFDWYSVFLINIPVVIIALQGWFFIKESRDENAPKTGFGGYNFVCLRTVLIGIWHYQGRGDELD